MTGPEHYREAERLLATLGRRQTPHGDESEIRAIAQVHATLALAAATALSTAPGHEPYDYGEWREVTGA